MYLSVGFSCTKPLCVVCSDRISNEGKKSPKLFGQSETNGVDCTDAAHLTCNSLPSLWLVAEKHRAPSEFTLWSVLNSWSFWMSSLKALNFSIATRVRECHGPGNFIPNRLQGYKRFCLVMFGYKDRGGLEHKGKSHLRCSHQWKQRPRNPF